MVSGMMLGTYTFLLIFAALIILATKRFQIEPESVRVRAAQSRTLPASARQN
jgi:hypothetical protein